MDKEKDNKYFHYYNNNPKGRNKRDCVYRSLGLFLEKSWEEIAELDRDMYLDKGIMLCSPVEDVDGPIGAEFLVQELGHKEIIILDKPMFYTVQDFIDEQAALREKYFVIFRNHVTVIKDKQIWDTWNCYKHFPERIYKYKPIQKSDIKGRTGIKRK